MDNLSILINKKPKKIYREKPLFPNWVYGLFFVFSAYMTIPFIDIPLIGLSLSAPLFFFIAFFAIFKSPINWFRTHKSWIILAIFIWLGSFISVSLNGLLSGGVRINSDGLLSIIRIAYWLLIFVVTIYITGQLTIITKTTKILGMMVFILGLLRWIEVFQFGSLITWSAPRWMSQNSYGFLFSIFSPFLLVSSMQNRGWKRIFYGVALLILWGAIVLNGSRGSWISLIVGLIILLVFLFITHVRKFLGVFIGLSFLLGTVFVVIVGIPQISDAITARFDTLISLEQDKSYVTRQVMNQKAIRLFMDSPLIGVGLSRFRLTSIELDVPSLLSYVPLSVFDAKSAHNSYLAHLAETGVVGSLPFAILLLVLFIEGFFHTKWLLKHDQFWALAIFLSFVQMSVHMWVISALFNSGTWFIYGLTGAMIMISAKLKTNNEFSR